MERVGLNVVETSRGNVRLLELGGAAAHKVVIGREGLADKATLQFIAKAQAKGITPWHRPGSAVGPAVFIQKKAWRAKDPVTGFWAETGRVTYYLCNEAEQPNGPSAKRAAYNILV